VADGIMTGMHASRGDHTATQNQKLQKGQSYSFIVIHSHKNQLPLLAQAMSILSEDSIPNDQITLC
jgi:hypothetical protein